MVVDGLLVPVVVTDPVFVLDRVGLLLFVTDWLAPKLPEPDGHSVRVWEGDALPDLVTDRVAELLELTEVEGVYEGVEAAEPVRLGVREGVLLEDGV